MTHIKGTSRDQTIFLRACSRDPWGLTQKNWPSATVFRRWMRRRGFRVAIKDIRDSLRFSADMHLAAASAAAAQLLAKTIMSDEELSEAQQEKLRAAKEQIASLTMLLRLAHLRQRFAGSQSEPPEPMRVPSDVKEIFNEMRMFVHYPVHPSHTIGRARELMAILGHTREIPKKAG